MLVFLLAFYLLFMKYDRHYQGLYLLHWSTVYLQVRYKLLIRSPELKAPVDFPNYLLFIVCLSVNLLHLHFLKNHWAKYNQTWYKKSLDSGIINFFK